MESGTLYLMALVLFFVGTMIYNNYLCIEVRLTKYLEKELAKEYEITPRTPWKIIGLEIESTTHHHRSGNKTYHCVFGLLKGYKDGQLDIAKCEAPVLYSKKYKPKYNMISVYEKKD
jgi:hypothetical protein